MRHTNAPPRKLRMRRRASCGCAAAQAADAPPRKLRMRRRASCGCAAAQAA
jgi:hypothetical protein